jgi:hypothetical protein
MALIYSDDDKEDQLVVWIRQRLFALNGSDTLVAYWLRQLKDRSTYRLARMALDIALIPAILSECK